MAENEEKYLSFEEAMARLSLGRPEIYRRVKDGVLKGEKAGRHLRFAASEVERYAGVLDEQGNALLLAVERWTAFFAGRLPPAEAEETLQGEDATPVPEEEKPPQEEKEKTAAERVPELGQLVVRDALLAGARDLYLDPLHEGDRLLYGFPGRRQEVARFEACLSAPLKIWLRGLAPLPAAAAGKVAEVLGQHKLEERTAQFRLTAVPTLLGEHIHLHFFADGEEGGLEELGYAPEQAQTLEPLLGGRPGLLLLVGPADPGDELHRLRLAHRLSASSRLVVSLEHQVQYRSEQLIQLDLSAAELDFEALWRTALNMSPDAVMLDEVRDVREARALLEGVQGGALVLAQVRAGGAADALRQLLAYELDKETLSRALLGLVERATLRRLCAECRTLRPLEAKEAALLRVEAGARTGVPQGCAICGDGFQGRRPVYGLWLAEEPLRAWIRAPEGALPTAAGFLGLAEAVRRAVVEGEVSLEDAHPFLPPSD